MKPFTSTRFKGLELLPLHGDLLTPRSHGIKLKEYPGKFELLRCYSRIVISQLMAKE